MFTDVYRLKTSAFLDMSFVLCICLKVELIKTFQVALLGKVENVWKCWQLDDVSRIETPLGIGGEESFPLGVCIDTSSQIAVKLSEQFVSFIGLNSFHHACWLRNRKGGGSEET